MRAVLCTAFEGIKSLTIGETEQPQARSQVPHRALGVKREQPAITSRRACDAIDIYRSFINCVGICVWSNRTKPQH